MPLRRLLLGISACSWLVAQELPGWWKSLADLPHLETRFIQESESQVFGKLKKTGQLQLSRGGRIRVAYAGGLVVVGDGRTLVQFDPQTRTAQRFDIRAAATEMPIIRILLDPRALGDAYLVRPGDRGSLRLEPRRTGLLPVEVQGKGAWLEWISWVDGTGARQTLRFHDTRTPGNIPETVYKIRVPEGTRWIQ